MGKLIITDISEVDNYSSDMLKRIDKALVASAIEIRNKIRGSFVNSGSIYKNRTEKYKDLSSGIMIGKLNKTNDTIKIHALGYRGEPDSWKTKFFVGGTMYRKQTKKAGQSIKPFSKGYIKANNALDKGTRDAESTMNTFLGNVIKN